MHLLTADKPAIPSHPQADSSWTGRRASADFLSASMCSAVNVSVLLRTLALGDRQVKTLLL